MNKMTAADLCAVSPLTRLQTSWLGKKYTTYLKKYAFINWFVGYLWRYGYPFYIGIGVTKRKAKRWRKLTSLYEFSKNKECPVYKMLDAVSVKTPMPKVFPFCDQDYLASPHEQYEFPEIFVAVMNNATVFGRTNFIVTDGEIVCHDLYDFERDYTSEELHGRAVIDPVSKRIRWLHHDEAPIRVPKAAAFVDACSTNYAHWLTEVLPRISVFCSEERFKEIPIVVDDRLHKNILESLLLVAGAEREVIVLPVGRALSVDELYVTSVVGYVPFGRRTNKLSGHSHGMFSSTAIELLRKKVHSFEIIEPQQNWPEKIFLCRNSGARQVINAIELETQLVNRGYVLIEPEKLSFLQQVQLFKNAKIIVSPTGAALANAIFCEPQTQVNILMAKHQAMVYRYWCNMLMPLQIKVGYALCDMAGSYGSDIHGSYTVNIRDVIDLLET